MSSTTLEQSLPASVGFRSRISRLLEFAGRFQHLAILLWVSLAMPLTGSFYHLLGGQAPPAALQNYRLIGALLMEGASLALLAYILARQGKSFRSIGFSFEFADVARAVGLLIVVYLLSTALLWPAQYAYFAFYGRWMHAKSLTAILGFGISFLSITFALVNPFFEELIVRAYTISELTDLSGRPALAAAASVVIQLSYHLYQGFVHVLGLAIVFTAFSVYYIRTRRIMPVILVHCAFDLWAVIRGAV